MELTGRITGDVMRNSAGRCVLMIEVDKVFDANKCFNMFKGKDIDVNVLKHVDKRSISANNYFWQLVDKIAVKMRADKNEIYRGYIRGIGGNSYDFHIDAEMDEERIRDFEKQWITDAKGRTHIGRFVEVMPEAKGFIIRTYKGSSAYNKAQMSRLIDFAVQDAQALDIETKTPNQIAEMLSLWESEK